MCAHTLGIFFLRLRPSLDEKNSLTMNLRHSSRAQLSLYVIAGCVRDDGHWPTSLRHSISGFAVNSLVNSWLRMAIRCPPVIRPVTMSPSSVTPSVTGVNTPKSIPSRISIFWFLIPSSLTPRAWFTVRYHAETAPWIGYHLLIGCSCRRRGSPGDVRFLLRSSSINSCTRCTSDDLKASWTVSPIVSSWTVLPSTPPCCLFPVGLTSRNWSR